MNRISSPVDFDVLVVGGGLAGLLFLNRLARLGAASGHPLSLAVVEAQPPSPLPAGSIGLRVSALSPLSVRLLEEANVWQRLPPLASCAYERMRVWQGADGPGGSRALQFDAAELGVAALGYIADNAAVRDALWQTLDCHGVTRFTAGPATSVRIDADAVHLVLAGHTVSAALLVGADGAQSWVRQQLGIGFAARDRRQSALVAHVRSTRGHEHTAWQRFLPGGPLALLPLADGRSSLVWSCSDPEADRLLALDDAEFAYALTAAAGDFLGTLQCTTSRLRFPLVSGVAETAAGNRFALLGDAAHRVHPLAGQGINLGLLDAAVLVDELLQGMERRGFDPGDGRVLQRFARRRAGHARLILESMDGLDNLFRHAAPLAGAGLGLVDRLAPVKRRMARYAMGLEHF